ncbi:amino acid ABC transporter permease [Chitinimonas naiadis]
MAPPAWLGQNWLDAHYLGWLLQGLLLTAWLSLLVCLSATLAGIVLTTLKQSRLPPARWAAQSVLAVLRNTPLLVQLLLWYFAVPSLFPESVLIWLNTPRALALPLGLALPWPSFEFLAAWVALACYSGAFIAEELAAGINGVRKEQRQAALALGMTPWQGFRWIILPQAWAIVRHPLLGQYTGAIKNTSLTMTIGVAELSYRSRQVESATLLTFQSFAVATLLYLVFILISQALGQLRQQPERQWSR